MGREAKAYVFVAVKITIAELRQWLIANKKGYDDSKYTNSDEDQFKLVTEWAGYYDAPKGRLGVFAATDYEDESIESIHCGFKLYDGWHPHWSEAESTSSSNFSTALKHSETLKALFPKKTVKLVTLQTVI